MKVLALVLLLGLALIPAAAAGQAVFEIDSSSHFHFPSLGLTGTIPGGSLPVKILQRGRKSWSLRIPSSGVQLAPWTAATGEVIGATLTEDATGSCSVKGKTADCSVQTEFLVQAGTHKPQFLPLTFTTGSVSKTVGGKTASRSGKKLDLNTDLIELVAAGETPPQAGLRASQPFYVVLVGRLTGTP